MSNVTIAPEGENTIELRDDGQLYAYVVITERGGEESLGVMLTPQELFKLGTGCLAESFRRERAEKATAQRAENDERLRAAIEQRRVVLFKYRDAEGQSSTRVVSPHALSGLGEQRTLQCYDHGREDWRDFRLARIEGTVQSLVLTGATDASGEELVAYVSPEEASELLA